METYRTVTFEEIWKSEEVNAYIKNGNDNLGVIGFTEHGLAHAKRSSDVARQILQSLGYDARTCELAAIAGYMHDIGNVVNRSDHAQSGALMAFTILNKLQMDPAEIALVVAAIGNHDEGTAAAVNPIAAALILSDKSDVRRSRVRDKRDRGCGHPRPRQLCGERSAMEIDPKTAPAVLNIVIDTTICPVMEYFEIFLTRMVLCRQAAQFLNLQFELIINDTRLL